MFAYIEEHPYLSGSLVVGLIVIFVVVRNASSGSGSGGGSTTSYTGPSESLQAAGLTASAQVQAYQIQGMVQRATVDAHVMETEILASADVTKTWLAQNVALESIRGTVDVTKYVTDAQLKLGLAQLGTPQPIVYQPPTTPIVYGAQNAINNSIAAETRDSAPVGYWDSKPSTTPHQAYEVCDASSVGSQNACAQRNVAAMSFNEQIAAPAVSWTRVQTRAEAEIQQAIQDRMRA